MIGIALPDAGSAYRNPLWPQEGKTRSEFSTIFSLTTRATMKLSESIKPISYLKSHAADVLRQVAENRRAVVITQNGEAKAVVQDIKTFEEVAIADAQG